MGRKRKNNTKNNGDSPATALKRAQVLRSTGSWYLLRNEAGAELRGRLRGKLRLKNFKVTNPITVGDFVLYHEDEKGEDGHVIISKIEERKNFIIRKSPKREGFGHLIAANLDQAILVVTLAFPRTSLGFIDRFLVTSETFRIPALLVFNKQDLIEEGELFQEVQEEVIEMYEAIGYSCLKVSALKEEGLTDFKSIVENKLSVISGHSGVGKSTLLNALSPEIQQNTKEISEAWEKGQHTTTFAEMFEPIPNTFLIDTPGINEMGLIQIEKQELAHYFPEFRELLGACRFHNCTHNHEPGCAVKAAVEEGLIFTERYESYLSMLLGDDNRR
jgi:ribosome biogenesis GTPase